MDNLSKILNECQGKMKSILCDFNEYLRKIKVDTLSPGAFDNINILYNNSYTKIRYLASIELKHLNTVYIKPWEKKNLTLIEKSITASLINFTICNDGEKLTIIMLPPTKQKRLLLIKEINNANENEKVKIRNIRRTYNCTIRQKIKTNNISLDSEKEYIKNIQFATDNVISELNKLHLNKIKNIEKL